MPNIRILYNNVADDCSSIAADSTSGTLVAANLLTDIKTEVHRSTSTTVRYTLEWASLQTLNMVALPFCNLTSTATIRARLYTNTSDVVGSATPAVDSGAVLACAYATLGTWAWGAAPLGVNAFSYGGATYGRVYFTAAQGRKLVVDVVDVDNTAGYIDAARMVTGYYWTPEKNPAYGASVAPNSNTQGRRTDAGDLRTERRPQHRALKIELHYIGNEEDRATVYDLLVGNGMTRPVFVSLFPENADPRREQAHQVYGKLVDSEMSAPSYGVFAAPLQVEEI
jgi:hypothetical protein